MAFECQECRDHRGRPERILADAVTRHQRASPSVLQPVVFSTLDLPDRDQFAAWHDQCAAVIDLFEALGPGPGFAARHEVWKLGPLR
jgi:hypothetical protein